MTTATERVDQALTVLPWLAAHPGITKAAAAAHFGMSPADLDSLLGLMFYIDIPEHPTLWYDIHFLEDDTITVEQSHGLDRPLTLRADEAATLVLGLRQLAGQPWLTHRSAVDSALAKLEALTGGEVPEVASVPVDPAVSDAIAVATRAGRRLRIGYHSAGGDATERDVDPLRTLSADGHGYLQAWCHRAGAVRTFRLDRISQATVLTTSVDAPGAAVEDPGEPVYRPAPDDLTAVIDLQPEARWVPEYYPVEESTDLGDGRLRVSIRSSSRDWLLRLMLRLGPAASVVAPDDLAAAVRAEAAAALAGYADG